MAANFIDFAELKAQVGIAKVMQMLDLRMKQQGVQYRGACPACRSGGDRALAINTDKQSFYCFAQKIGGDAISLCAHIRGVSQRDAANLIANHFKFAGNSEPGAQRTSALSPSKSQAPRAGFDPEAYLRGLDPNHESLQALGVSPETLATWRAGYAKTGVLRAKLAIALCDREGAILGFCGRSVDGSQPLLTFPSGVNPSEIIFGADKIGEGDVRLLREPLEVMQASEVGEPALCFLTDAIEPVQFEMLASLLDAKKARVFY